MCFVDAMNDDGHRTESLGCSVPWTICPDPLRHTGRPCQPDTWTSARTHKVVTSLRHSPFEQNWFETGLLCKLRKTLPPHGGRTVQGTEHPKLRSGTHRLGGWIRFARFERHRGIKRRRPSRKMFQHLDRNQRRFWVGITEGKIFLTTICTQKNKREY